MLRIQFDNAKAQAGKTKKGFPCQTPATQTAQRKHHFDQATILLIPALSRPIYHNYQDEMLVVAY